MSRPVDRQPYVCLDPGPGKNGVTHLPDSLYELLATQATKEGMQTTALARKAIRRYLANPDPGPLPQWDKLLIAKFGLPWQRTTPIESPVLPSSDSTAWQEPMCS